jgi:hypothetical protein
VAENLQKTLGSLAETRDNALWFNRKGGSTMMEAIWIILPVGYILGMIALAVFSGGGHGNRTITNGRRDDDDSFDWDDSRTD